MLSFTNPLFLSSFVSAILFPTCNLILITRNPIINPTFWWKSAKPAFRQETLSIGCYHNIFLFYPLRYLTWSCGVLHTFHKKTALIMNITNAMTWCWCWIWIHHDMALVFSFPGFNSCVKVTWCIFWTYQTCCTGDYLSKLSYIVFIFYEKYQVIPAILSYYRFLRYLVKKNHDSIYEVLLKRFKNIEIYCFSCTA